MADTLMLHVLDERAWLSRKQVIRYLRERGIAISLRTLIHWGSDNNHGNGPSFTQVRRGPVRYHKDDVDRWIAREARRVQ